MEQQALNVIMQSAATANGNGTQVNTSGYTGAIQIEVAETNNGTATLTLQGSFDGTNWYSLGYQRVDGQATLTRAASGISVTGNTRKVYQVLDPYPQMQAAISSISSATITVRLYGVPA